MIGILYNTFVCLIAGCTSLIVFSLLQKKRRKGEISHNIAIDYFLLCLGLLWVFVGVRLFFVWLDWVEADLFLYKWFVGPLSFLHLLPAFYYFGWSFFKGKKSRFLFNGFFTLTVFSAVLILFLLGFERPEVTYWGNNIKPNKISNTIFTFGVFLPALPILIIEISRRIKGLKEKRNHEAKQLFGFSIGFLIYALAGFFEALVFTQGWMMLITRTGIMLAALVFYLSATWENNT